MRRLLRSPITQLLAATGVMVAGAWLVAWWMVGLVLMLAGLLLGLDAVLKDTSGASTHRPETARERFRRAA